MRVKLSQTGTHTAWQEGEILTIQVLAVADNDYECETLETFPADLKDRHRQELADQDNRFAQMIQELQAKHEVELTKASIPRESN